MAISALIYRFWRSSWNPLRNNTTGLPPHVLVVAKSFAIFLLIKTLFFSGAFFRLREPYLPFISVFDKIGHPVLVLSILQIALYTSAVAILFNRHVKFFCLIAGSCILLSLLSAKGSYSNNFLFTSFILLLVGLQMPGENKSSWIRYQLAVLYIGAALNKMMESDWQTGVFMDYWMNSLPIPIFQHLAVYFPPMVFAKIVCWFTIIAEATLGILAISNRFTSLLIFLGIAFHFGLALVTGRTYGWFFPMLVVSYAAIIPWPANPVKVLYDGDCGFCEKTKWVMKKWDIDDFFIWTPFQFEKEHYGLTSEQFRERLYMVADGKIYSGFRAFRAMILYNPLSYLFFIVLVASLSPAGGFTVPAKLLIGSLLLFVSPIFIPVGEVVYAFIAKRRYKMPGSTESCEIPQLDESSEKTMKE